MKTLEDIIKNMFENAQKNGIENTDELTNQVIVDSLSVLTNVLKKTLSENFHSMVSEHRYIHDEIIARLNRRWFEAFDRLEEFIVISEELCADIGQNCKKFNTEETTYLFHVLLPLHGRAIQTAREILLLMKNGYADGAMARWRTLYEITIISIFISENGNDTAKRYLDYIEIESYKEMEEYNKYAPKLEFEEISSDEIKKITDIRNSLIEKYDKNFIKKYGWAFNILKKEKIDFIDIESSINFNHYRPIYKWACNTVHAGPKYAYYKIGKFKNDSDILTGPTNYGFADPGQYTALSILQITSIIISLFHTIDNIVGLNILNDYYTELKNKFCDIQKQIELEENDKENY